MRPKTTDRDIGMHTFTVEIVLEAQTLKNSDELCQLFVHIQLWTAQKYKYKYQNGDELCPSCVQIQLMTAHKYGGDLLIGSLAALTGSSIARNHKKVNTHKKYMI